MNKLSQIWQRIQNELFPFLTEALDPLTEKQKKLAAILEFIRIEDYVHEPFWHMGRPKKDRMAMARAFVLKAAYNIGTTAILIELLRTTKNLRRICGFEKTSEIPSEATFSRAFERFALTGLPQKVHETIIREYESERIVGHISRDSTEISAREKPAPKAGKKEKEKRKRGRPKDGETPLPKEASPLELQRKMTLTEILEGLSRQCDWGTKRDSHGKKHTWKGYKFHVDWADGEVPISCILTSASVHDSQVAIPLMRMTTERVTYFYDLQDAAYDAKEIEAESRLLGHVPITDKNPRRGEKIEMEPAVKARYNERNTAERGNSLIKDGHGGRDVRVRGHVKVMAHLMFGILAIAAERLLNLLQ